MHSLTGVGLSVDEIIEHMRASPSGVHFRDACKVADAYFGAPRQRGTSHVVYKMPWAGDPRVNLQNDHGLAKPYQIKQLLSAIERVHNGQ